MPKQVFAGYLLKSLGECTLLKNRIIRLRDDPVGWILQRLDAESVLSLTVRSGAPGRRQFKSKFRDFSNGEFVRVTIDSVGGSS
ncbi:MAG: hypothetical protein ABSF09_13455 [Candidatus Bathyarchaeia archaeon]